MYPGLDRPAWQQSPPPQSQPGWFPLEEVQQSPVAQSGWLQDATSSDYATSSRAYASSSAAPPSPYWTTEPPSQSPPTRFLPSPTYPRPLTLEPELYDRAQGQEHKSTVLRRNKQIAIGRWNSEEHQWFLKGLEMFQGPAWGEIARLIGSRTSTQVRTHAQKFFTKLARLNQTMPYFEVQINKERARLVAQGASVSPTAQSVPSATLSPRKRLATATTSPRQTLKRFKEETANSSSIDVKYLAQQVYDTKPRVLTSGYASTSPVMTKEWTQLWTAEDARQWPLASPTSTAASLQLTQLQLGDASTATASDAESLPSMNKLLYRSTT